MKSSNVLSVDWVPVLTKDNVVKQINLASAFSESESISTISGDFVTRISIIRLMLCIAQDALDGPEDEHDWLRCKKRILPAVKKYLKKHYNLFDLYGKKPFLQNPFIKRIKNHGTSFLDFSVASGNQHTLFSTELKKTKAQEANMEGIAKNLLATQIFSECGFKSKATGATWSKKHIKSMSGKSSVSINLLLSLIEGDSLLDTLYYNLVTKEAINETLGGDYFGDPLWKLNIKNRKNIKPNTYLYNLVPLSRSILLEKGTDEISICVGVPPATLEQKNTFSYIDPMGTIVLRKDKNKQINDYLKVDITKAPWRDLGSILMLKIKDGCHGPVALHHFGPDFIRHEANKKLSINVGGFKFNKAKPIIICDWRLTVPASMLQESTLDMYNAMVKKANRVSGAIRYAIKTFLRKEDDKKEDNKMYVSLCDKSITNYWFSLEKCAMEFLSLTKFDKSLWERGVKTTARAAFKSVCRYSRRSALFYLKANKCLEYEMYKIFKEN